MMLSTTACVTVTLMGEDAAVTDWEGPELVTSQ